MNDRGFKTTEFIFKAIIVVAGAVLVGLGWLDATYYWTGVCALAGIYGIERTIQKQNGGQNHNRKEGIDNVSR